MLKQLFIVSVLFCSFMTFGQEVCDNGIDDDGDGLIDLNDVVDCSCTIAPNGSIIPNPSFENYSVCPTSPAGMLLVNDWVQGSAGSTDYYNLCGMAAWGTNVVPATPLPGGGSGYAGGYNTNEFIAVCLNGTYLANTAYTIDFYVAYARGDSVGDIALYGSPDCNDIAAFSTSGSCPMGIGQWVGLDSITLSVSGSGAWQLASFSFTPAVNINAIAIGANCQGINGLFLIPPVFSYFYYDNFDPGFNNASYDSVVNGGLCTNDLLFDLTPLNITSSIQWYLDGVALVGETGQTLNGTSYGPGLYSVVYTVNGTCQRNNFNVPVPQYPQSNFTVQENCIYYPSLFFNDTALSTVDIVSWIWLLGDSTTSQSYNEFHSYAQPGGYDVTLVVTSEEGCNDSLTIPIIVGDEPEAAFNFEINTVIYQVNEGDTINTCVNDTLWFSDLSTITLPDSITNFYWDFGDQVQSSAQNPNHKYQLSGQYDVSLIVESNHGCVDTFSCVIDVKDSPVANYAIINFCENENIIFNNTSFINSGTFTSNWTFGDNSFSTQFSPLHQYAAGNYQTKLVVESNFGCVDSLFQPINIFEAPVAGFQIANHCLNEAISFTDQSTTGLVNIISWLWDFGDNQTSGTANTLHSYTNDSTYTVTLIVENANGCSDTANQNYTIYPVPDPDIIVTPPCENQEVEILNNSSINTGIITQYNWSFGNGLTSVLETPEAFSYSNAGNYPFSLVMVSDFGCTDSVSTTITVHKTPLALILDDPFIGCSPLSTPMFNFVNDDVAECIWNFGDGTIVVDCGSVQNTYVSGVYDVMLTVYSPFGCVDSVKMVDFVTVYETPSANFDFSPNTVFVGDAVKFINQTVAANSFLWNFGDGSPLVSEEHPIHYFPHEANAYSITLIALNDTTSCMDTTKRILFIKEDVVFYVPNAFTPNESGVNDVFLPVMTSGIDIYEYKLTICNRWGEVVFISYNPAEGWDGRYNGKVVQNGVYVWQIDYEVDLKDERFTERGIINVIK